MKQPFEITRDGDLTRILFSEVADYEQLIRAMNRLANLPVSPRRLWDLRAGLTLIPQEVPRIADLKRRSFDGPGRVAIVTADELSLRIADVIGALRSLFQTPVGVFRDEAEALAWLSDENAQDHSPGRAMSHP